MRKLFTLIGLVYCIGTSAQTTYFSKPLATDFNNVSSWGTATNGSGTAPASISSADIFVIGNGANMVLTAKTSVRSLYIGSVAGFVPAASAGSLTLSSVDSLIVSLPTGNNATLAIGTSGNLSIAGSTLLLNGNLNHSAGQFSQSGGRIIIDGNNGNAATSVASGTSIVRLTNNLSLTGGNLTIVNPHIGTTSTSYALSYNSTTDINVSTAHTLTLGDSVSTIAGGVAEGFHLYLTASSGRLKLGNMVVNGGNATKRWVKITSSSTDPQVGGNLTINPAGEYRMISSNLSVAGDILNNGILTTSGTLDLHSANSQAIGGSGVFRNSATAVTANFANLTVNNTSTTGITFTGTAWSSEASTVSGQFTTSARINMPVGDTFTLGTGPSYSLAGNYVSGAGGFTGGTVRRWTSVALMPIGSPLGEFPFISPGTTTVSNSRTLFVGLTGSPASGGLITVTYTPAPGNHAVLPFQDGGTTVSAISNDKWELFQNNINLSSGYWALRLAADGFSGYSSLGAVRITGSSGTVFAGNTSSAGTISNGITYANKSLIAAGDLNATITELHVASQQEYRTAGSGNWEDGSTWVGGISPGLGCEGVNILTGDTVTVNSTACSTRFLNVDTGGALIVNGSTLTVGCTGVLSDKITSKGAVTVNNGQLIINGTLLTTKGFFTQTGGIITVSGRSDDIVNFQDPTVLNLTGGAIIIANPSSSTTGYAFRTSIRYAESGTHTFQFGDGVSTTSGTTAGMAIYTPNGCFKFNGITVSNKATATNNRSVTFGSDVVNNGNLNILQGGIFEISSGKTFAIAGNILNNGTLTTAGYLEFEKDFFRDSIATTSQTVSGSGIFQNAASAATANFAGMLFNNSSAGGITFTGTTWNNAAATVSGSLTFYKSLNRINIGTAVFTLGTSATAPGSLSYLSGGFTSGTFKRWIGTTAITYTGVAGLFPFASAASASANSVRNVSINTNSLTTGGTVSIKHADVAGTSAVIPFTDNGISIERVSNANWAISQSGLAPTTATFGIQVSGEGAILPVNPYTARITGATSSTLTVGINDTGSGTPVIPQGSKNGTTVNTFSVPRLVYLGSPKSVASIQSGPYESAATWSGGIVPSLCDNVVIDAGDTVVINTAPVASGDLFINPTAALIQNGSTMTVGCGTNHTSVLTNLGTLTQNGGSLNINGAYAQSGAAAVFNETGGTFVVDGNDAGNVATSMRLNSPLISVTGGKLNLSGGTMVLTDPPADFNSAATLNITISDSASGSHVLQFGDGISVDLGRGTNGIYLKSPSFKFRHLVAKNNNSVPGTYRHASIADNFYALGDITIEATGDLRNTSSNKTLNLGGNLTNRGKFVIDAILNFNGNAPQTVSGSGMFTTITAPYGGAFGSLSFSNNSAGGVTFSGTGWHAAAITVANVIDLKKGYLNRINIGIDTFILGSSAAGSFSNTYGGFTGGTFGRYIGISAVSFSSGTGLFPFVSPANATTNYSRNLNISNSGLLVGGYAFVTYTDGVGTIPIAPFIDNGSEINQVSNATWRVSHKFGPPPHPYGQFNITGLRITAQGISSAPLLQGLRITGDTGSVYTVNATDYGSGTVSNPEANKTLLLNNQIDYGVVSPALHIGIDKAFQTAQSGPWETGTTWVGGISPGISCSNIIINNSHNITVSAGAAGAKNLAVMAGGGLTIQGSGLVLGCDTLRNYQLTNAGTLTVTGGTLRMNGSIINQTGSTFVQSGGNIIIDPNDRGNAATSALGDVLNFPSDGASYSLTGGSITILDPPVPSFAAAVSSSTAAFPAQGTHTLILGDGVSNDTTIGFWGFYLSSGATAMSFQNLIVNGPSTGHRYVRSAGALGILGNLTINTGGTLKISTTAPGLSVAGNITVNNGGVLDGQGTGMLSLQRYVAGIATSTTTAQVIGGNGNYVNDATAPTANFYNLTINNSSAGGVTFNPLNTIGINPTGVSVSSLIYFTKGKLAMSSGTFINGTPTSGDIGMILTPGSGIVPGSTYAKWYSSTSTGSAINPGVDPTYSNWYPFISPNGEDRKLWIERNGPTAGGLIAATFTDAGTVDFDTMSIADSNYTVNRRLKDSWKISVLNGTPNATSFEIAAISSGSYELLSPTDNRLVQMSGTVGKHQAGTATPGAQRKGLSLQDLTSGAFYIGTAAGNIVESSIMSGNWSNPAIWRSGRVPVIPSNARILSPHTVTVNSPGAQCGGLTVYDGGTLQMVTGGYLTIGAPGDHVILNFDNGDLDMTGGTLEVNGTIQSGASSSIILNGGNLIIH